MGQMCPNRQQAADQSHDQRHVGYGLPPRWPLVDLRFQGGSQGGQIRLVGKKWRTMFRKTGQIVKFWRHQAQYFLQIGG